MSTAVARSQAISSYCHEQEICKCTYAGMHKHQFVLVRFAAPVMSKCMMEDEQSAETAMLDEEESLLVTNRLHQVLRPFMLRRLTESVATELPPKVSQAFSIPT